MTRERRHDEDRRLVAGSLFAKMQELAERVRRHDLFGDGDFLAFDDYLADPEFRPIVRHPGIGKQLHRRRRATHQRDIPNQRPRLDQHAAEELGHQANRGEYVAVYLVGVVKHMSSYLPAPEFGNLQTIETVSDSIDPKAKSSHRKTSAISRVYLHCQSFRQGGEGFRPWALQLSGGIFEDLVNAAAL